jgi:hypothetical protein
VTQVEEHLPSKCEALSSNPSTEEKKTKEGGCTCSPLHMRVSGRHGGLEDVGTGNICSPFEEALSLPSPSVLQV